MLHKTRLQKTINHQEPDKVVIDFGSTPVTGVHVSVISDLRDYYGLDKHPVKVIEPYQMLGEIEPDLLNIIGGDVIGIPTKNNIFGFSNKNWKEFKLPWDQEVLVPEDFNTDLDVNGDLLIYPEGDKTVPPSGRMPKASYFFDSIIRQENIEEDKLDPADNLEEFKLLSDEDKIYFEEQIPLIEKSNRGTILNLGGTALGDIALVPAPFLKKPKGIRDISEWYMSTVMRQDYLHTIFDKQTEIAIENLKTLFNIVGNSIDILFMCGTDFGTQDSTFCSTETFEILYSPYYKRMNDWIHRNTEWKTFKHSCGAVESLIPNLIEAGFDILNPVQCSASGMDPKILKEKYGEQITFWGGGVDTQQTLPFGIPVDVRKEVLSRCEIFSPGGGFVFNTIHNVQAKTPIQNIVAMIDAIKEFNGES